MPIESLVDPHNPAYEYARNLKPTDGWMMSKQPFNIREYVNIQDLAVARSVFISPPDFIQITTARDLPHNGGNSGLVYHLDRSEIRIEWSLEYQTNHLLYFSPLTGLLERVAIQKRIEVIDQYGARMLPQFWMQMRLGLSAPAQDYSGYGEERGFEVAFDLPDNMAMTTFSGRGKTIKISPDGKMKLYNSEIVDEEDGLIFSYPTPGEIHFPYKDRSPVDMILMSMFEYEHEIMYPHDGANKLGRLALKSVFSHLGYAESDLAREVSKYKFNSYI